MAIFQLVYVSKASDSLDLNELPSILKKSREANQKKDISGLLIFHEGSFIQVLEGPKEEVEPLFKVIEKDPRHVNIKLLSQRELEEKEFETWSMGFFNSELSRKDQDFINLASELGSMLTDGTASEKALRRFREGAWKKLVEG